MTEQQQLEKWQTEFKQEIQKINSVNFEFIDGQPEPAPRSGRSVPLVLGVAWKMFLAAKRSDSREIQVCPLGYLGKAYDPPFATRAYTYDNQPGNGEAMRLGVALREAIKIAAGDEIDMGLNLLRTLKAQGYGVFEVPKRDH